MSLYAMVLVYLLFVISVVVGDRQVNVVSVIICKSISFATYKLRQTFYVKHK